ncbi:MAG TPA: STAS domain-containing protein [Terriglobales bacterium]|nr:STAS domain-containing protein [Terriglobales bacterium]
MRKSSTPVLIRRLPARVDAEVVRILMRELAPSLRSDGPRLVFDLAQVEEMDAAGVDMLLTCMTEVSRRDGDLKLAAPSPRALVILELTQMDRLFEIFESSAEAAASFGVTPAANSLDTSESAPQASVEISGVEAEEESPPEPLMGRGRKLDSDVA